MGGLFGIVSGANCINDLFLGISYLQHRAQDYCGLALLDNKKFHDETHRGLVRQQFPRERLQGLRGKLGMASVSSDRQPVSELSRSGGLVMGFDGNLTNYNEVKEGLLRDGETFSGHHDPEKVSDSVLVSKIISKELNFREGIERLVEMIQGDFAIVALSKDGIYAARGWGRKPLVIGRKNGSYGVSSESNSFVNIGMKIVRDVNPGEIVLLNRREVRSLNQLDLKPVKFGTFEWIYTAYPASVIDGRSVSAVRKSLGRALARRYPVEADIVSPVPNSGRWHAIGYSQESGIPYEEVFVRYDYSDRSYTPGEQYARDQEAKTKLIPVNDSIKGKRIVIVDDSIVRGTQMLNRAKTLIGLRAEEVHARIACPPLMHACQYGKTTKNDKDCIARRMSIEGIKKELGLKSLGYATVEDLEEAIGYSRSVLCLECW